MICPETISAEMLRTVGWVRSAARSVEFVRPLVIVELLFGKVALLEAVISSGGLGRLLIHQALEKQVTLIRNLRRSSGRTQNHPEQSTFSMSISWTKVGRLTKWILPSRYGERRECQGQFAVLSDEQAIQQVKRLAYLQNKLERVSITDLDPKDKGESELKTMRAVARVEASPSLRRQK